MAKAKKTPINPEEKIRATDIKKPADAVAAIPVDNTLSINLAIGTLTLLATTILLIILNKIILSVYTPDINIILEKIVPLSVCSPNSFFPEPVERMQYQLSLLCMPLFVFASYKILSKLRPFFTGQPTLAFVTNIGGIFTFFIYISVLLKQSLLFVQDQTMGYFYANNTISVLNPLVALGIYAVIMYLFFLHKGNENIKIKNIIGNVVCYGLAFIVILDVVLYNVFHLPYQEWGRYMETNMLFYPITQVHAGKALLVNTSGQYGLYPWVLSPIFKIIGLDIFRFGMVMALLNGAAFLLIFLGIKRIIKQDILSIMVFMAFAWWMYWESRLPFETTARYYYQFYPIRIIFPALCFYLIVVYQTCTPGFKKIILPLLAFSASLGVLWNLDAGLVTYGAATIALISSAYNPAAIKDFLKKSLIYVVWMGGAMLLVLAIFMLSTKSNSGSWPDFAQFVYFQGFYYVSGYFMLPMSAIHFWNLPVLVYIITCIYCVYQLKQTLKTDTPVIVFLFVLGTGIFSYFQGRSYDMNVEMVIYPAVILLGIFCNKLMPDIHIKRFKVQFNERMVLFLIVFLFFIDTAFSMLYTTPEIHSFAKNNATNNDEVKDMLLKTKLDFVNSNLHKGDTVLILAKDYESYYYGSGEYVSPFSLPNSTEWYFKSDIKTILDYIKTTKHLIVIDRTHPQTSDTITKILAQYTSIYKSLPDKSVLILKPGKSEISGKLAEDAKTMYYCNNDDFSNSRPPVRLQLPDTFTVEFYATLDTGRLKKDNLMFTNAVDPKRPAGMFMLQNGDDLTNYMFTYGNGVAWQQGVMCKLSCSTVNHFIIKVQRNIITIYNNDKLVGQSNTNSSISNSEGKFFVNNAYSGVVEELKVSR